MLASEKALDLLEDRLSRVAEVMQSMRRDNGTLKKEIETLKKELEEARRESRAKDHMIRQFQDDRGKIRTRTQRILEKLSELEGQAVI